MGLLQLAAGYMTHVSVDTYDARFKVRKISIATFLRKSLKILLTLNLALYLLTGARGNRVSIHNFSKTLPVLDPVPVTAPCGGGGGGEGGSIIHPSP